jgi:hypothetical protein
MDPAAEGRLRKILASVGPGEDPDARPAGAGFKRYQTGRISIDIPQKLNPPLGYSFESMDGEVSMSVNFYEQPANWGFPEEEILDRNGEIVKIRGIPVTMLSYDIIRNVPDPGSRWTYRHAQIGYDDGVTVHINGNALAESGAELDRAFRELTGNVSRLE